MTSTALPSSLFVGSPRRVAWPAALRWCVAVVALALVAAAPSAVRAEEVVEPVRLDSADDGARLPVPRGASQVTRNAGPILSELKAAAAAEPVAVLAFYRRELARRGWTEEKTGAVDNARETRRNFSGAEGTAVLVLSPGTDGTTISLVVRASEEVVAARALEARTAERASRGENIADAGGGKALAAADAEGAAALGKEEKGGERLHVRSDAGVPIPLPQGAEAVVLDAAAGRLTFSAALSVRELEMFYRAALKPLGWNERPADGHPGVAALDFVKGDATLLLTFARDGALVTVTGSGSALKTAAR